MRAAPPPAPLLPLLLLLLALLAAPAARALRAESAPAPQPQAERQPRPSPGPGPGNATRTGSGAAAAAAAGGGSSNSSGDALVTRISRLLRDLPTLKAAVIVACAFTALLIACLLLRVFRWVRTLAAVPPRANLPRQPAVTARPPPPRARLLRARGSARGLGALQPAQPSVSGPTRRACALPTAPHPPNVL
uniref:membrane protein FAM174B n=1 Tax=Panthera onca TaxID=9690 RepID=UPI002952B075|nr:membrane protein FAM174B [Panthera onca]